MKLEKKKKNEDKDMIVNRNIHFKLPKLVITKLEKVDISAISKFFILKEFLIPNVRALIDGFIFTPEVYTRANSILLAKFGKPSEVAAAHIHCITFLPFFSNS